ncbi:MAG: DUF3592 domain-containing protein [Planctomycetota bacterium]
MKRLQELIIYAILVLIGLGTSAWYGPSQLMEAKATEDWPTVTGTIEDTRVTSQHRRRQTDYNVEITYTYVVGERTYRGSRYSVTGNPGAERQEEAELLARGFRKGDKVKVYVDPEDPTQAVLARGGTQKAWMTIGFGALLLVVGLFLGARRLLRP